MSVFRLILREISHRRLNFLLALASVAIAVGSLVGATTLLEADAIRTNEIMEEKQETIEKAGAELADAMRKIMKGLGFNILILPEGQELAEVHLEGTASKTMPEEYVHRLANSNIVTVNHLLPMVTRKIEWPEMNNRKVILVGTRGEVPIAHRDPKKPLLEHVPAGTMFVGYHVHKQLGLSKDQTVKLLGREFKVTQLYGERGTADDSSIWVNLTEAQEMLGLQNLVNAILALECNCSTVDRLAEVRAEIAGILPGTQVIERGPPALARAEARNKAAAAAKESLEQEKAGRERLRSQRQAFVAVLIPIIIVASAVWIALLAIMNVRQRRTEIGILRALGLRAVQIMSLFLGKAAFVGLFGAVIGYVGGFLVGMILGDLPASSETAAQLFGLVPLLAAVAMALVLSLVGSWIPSLVAVRQDPAVILQNE